MQSGSKLDFFYAIIIKRYHVHILYNDRDHIQQSWGASMVLIHSFNAATVTSFCHQLQTTLLQ